ncbi:unnamed protein product [Closterium sp. Naga37s-1]|nr:unnamed protein product [Closterium sp. Naga37s-1]
MADAFGSTSDDGVPLTKLEIATHLTCFSYTPQSQTNARCPPSHILLINALSAPRQHQPLAHRLRTPTTPSAPASPAPIYAPPTPTPTTRVHYSPQQRLQAKVSEAAGCAVAVIFLKGEWGEKQVRCAKEVG